MTSLEPAKKKAKGSKPTKTTGESIEQQTLDRVIPVSSNPRVREETVQQPGTPQIAAPTTKKGNPQTPAPTTNKATKQKKPTKMELLKDFAKVNPETDAKHTAAQWGYSLDDARLAWGIRNRESFDWLYSLTGEERKVARLEHVKAAKMDTKDEYKTLTKKDKGDLADLWKMTSSEFGNAIKEDAQYQYCRKLPPDQVSVLTRQEIISLTVVSPEVCMDRRFKNFEKLTDGDRAELKRRWKVDDPAGGNRFSAALKSVEAYNFFTELTIPQRRLISPALITAAKQLSREEWALQRREKSTTMLESDWQAVAQSWGIDVHDARIVAASDTNEKYQFFRKLSPVQRDFITASEIDALTRVTENQLKVRQKERQTRQQQETSQRRADAKADAQTRNQQSQEEQNRIAQQQTNGLSAAYSAAAQAYPKLRRTTLAAIRTQVKEEQEPRDFDRRARAAWELQRSPGLPETWSAWMDLRTRFIDLDDVPIPDLITGQPRLMEAHISLDAESLTLPTPTVTDNMTPDQLLDALFKPAPAPPAFANGILHVTLDTYTRNAGGGRSTPHRYWRKTDDASKRYELRTDGNLRWNGQQHTVLAIEQALDQAYIQMLVLLRERARRVLEDGGFTLRP